MVLTGPTPVQALQAAVNAGAAQSRVQGNPFWNVAQNVGAPHLLGGPLPQYFPQLQAAAAAQEQATSLVAVTRLGLSSSNTNSNSQLVVRSSVRKMSGPDLVSVGMWARKVVEDNLEWLVKLAKRHFPEEKAILLAYGDGYETLALFDDHINMMPADFSVVKKVGVGVSVADSDDTSDETKLAAKGVLQSVDSIWEHLRFNQMEAMNTKKDKVLSLHTSMTVWSDGIDGRQRVVQVKTSSENPCVAVKRVVNKKFEQDLLSKWRGKPMGASVSPPALLPTTAVAAAPAKTMINFNPKELLLLEKAFDNALTPRDLKTDVNKYNAEDKKKCQAVIRRAKEEIVTSSKKKRVKKAAAPKKVAPKLAPGSPKSKVVAFPESPEPSKKKEEADSDDEKPISALKPKAKAKTPAKKGKAKTPAKSSKSPAKAKEEEKETKKRGRPSKTASKSEPVAKKGRGKSKSRK